MKRHGRLVAVRLLLVTGLLGCSEETPSALRDTAPPIPRASVVLEPPQLGVGQVSNVEVTVVTPPDYSLRPVAPPSEVAGLWVLEAESLPVEKEPSRWIHRTRIRVRARAVGRSIWPAGAVEVQTSDGSVLPLPTPELEIEVASVLPEYPDRVTPFGVRAPPARGAPGNALGPAVAGALAALAAVGLVALERRRRRLAAQPAASAATPKPEPPWVAARPALAAARARAEDDPFSAADATGRALRRYVSVRFGTQAETRTTEELAQTTAPFAVRSRWPQLVSLLQGLDELRFLPTTDAAARSALRQRLASALSDAERFVEDTVPPEGR